MRNTHSLFLAALSVGCGPPDRVTSDQSVLRDYKLVSTIHVDDGSIVAGFRLPTGRVLVRADPGFIGVYDSSGAQTAHIGRKGSGPGEFRQLGWVGPGGPDSIWAYDLTLKRLSVFTESGRFLASWQLRGFAFGDIAARLADGTFVLTDPMMPMPRSDVGLRTDSVRLLVLRLPEVEPRFVGRRPWRTTYVDPSRARALIVQPWSARGTLTGSAATFWIGFGASPVVEEINPTGTVIGRRTFPIIASSLSPAEIAAVRNRSRSTRDGVGEASALYEHVPLPQARPYYRDILADGSVIWAALDTPSDTTAVRFVRSVSAAAYDTVTVPPRHQLLEAAAPYLVVRYEAADGDEFVRVYRRSDRGRTP
jgi:hypothetical protein